MAATSTKDALPYPTLPDTRDVPRDFLALVTAIDGKMFYQCTEATRPTGGARFTGRAIYETDTKAFGCWDGSVWRMYDTVVRTYTPVWRANGSTGPVPGTGGSLTGKYVRRGSLCWVRVEMIVGSSGFNGGNASYDFSAPFQAASLMDGLHSKTYAPNAGGNYTSFAIIASGSSLLIPYAPADSASSTQYPMQNANAGGAVATGIPLAAGAYTWTTTGNISITGDYPI